MTDSSTHDLAIETGKFRLTSLIGKLSVARIDTLTYGT
jgi:hypothetical protein